MHGYGKIDRLKIVLFLAFVLMLGLVCLSGARSAASGGDVKSRAQATTAEVTDAAPPASATTQKTRIHPSSMMRRTGSQPANLSGAAAATEDTSSAFEGCVSCHNNIEPMHVTESGKIENGKDGQGLTCTYCHGGNPAVRPKGNSPSEQERARMEAHVRPRFPDVWERDGKPSSANPERTNTLLNRESWEFVRFINPADLRVTTKTCAECHNTEVAANDSSMMRHGAFLWGAAFYNNGGFPLRDARFGEFYSEQNGAPERFTMVPQPNREQQLIKGWLPFLDPLPRWEISQPGNVLRVFERGGRRRLEVGLPDKEEEPGLPDKGLSPRGLGTANRTDPVYLGLQKTRLMDPTLNMLGTNDWPGDFRSSGCTACHVIYANDRSLINSGHYAQYGNMGMSHTADTSIPKDEPGHPIKHQFTSSIPTSQCMVCHMHPGTNMIATYTGMMWWDNETDGDRLYPAKQHNPSQDEEQLKLNRNPEGASLRGLWGERKFEDRLSPDDLIVKTGEPNGDFNKQLKRIQLADYHGHGWLFRAVFKRDREGNFIDGYGRPIKNVSAEKLRKAVAFQDDDNPLSTTRAVKGGQPIHLKDIHLEKGMHCADCHFRQDAHGTGILYNEPRAAIEINCTDCHGTIRERGKLVTSGPAAGQGIEDGQLVDKDKGRNLRAPRSGQKDISKNLYARDAQGNKIPLFELAPSSGSVLKKTYKDENGKDVTAEFKNGEIIQNSMVEPGKWWRVKQTKDTIDPKSPDYNELSRYAKTIRTDNQTWGDVPTDETQLAHRDAQMTCFACHSAWMTSCFGCHLSMKANRKMPNRHNEGDNSRNYTTYNFQVLRDDVFMLGRDGTTTGHRVTPVASRSAVLVSSQNQNREWIYSQQQTVSAEGFAGQSFSTHVPHTVRAIETKGCTDCHVSEQNNNNAWMAQILLQGTNFVNFIGRYVYIAAEDALEVVPVTEHDEPQAVKGSTLQKLAYPEDYAKFVKGGRKLTTAFDHEGNPKVLGVQLRGEYAYVAAGEGGLRVYDVAEIDHKGFSERITTAPVSRFGQRFFVKSKYAVAVASPSTLAVDPLRTHNPMNQEQPIHPLYGYLYVVDKYEGLILVGAGTLLDGDPLNNFLSRALTWNPNGVLNDANNIIIAGTHAYITTARDLVVVDINDPLKPQVVKQIPLNHPRAVAIQFRYGFVVDDDGLKVLDVTRPDQPQLINGATIKLADARDVYVARTYAYVADGKDGIAIVNVERPDQPKLDQMFNAEGKLNDAHQVKVAMTNASLYAYVADGKNGMRILQLTDPETMPTYAGFSPRPEPKLIAEFHTRGPALAISKGLDRDRAADESGNQVAVFGRRGARPFNLQEMQSMYLIGGKLFTVSDTPNTPPRDPNRAAVPPATPNKATHTDASGATQEAVSPYQNTLLSTRKKAGATAAVGGSFGLLLMVAGWRRFRRPRRR